MAEDVGKLIKSIDNLMMRNANALDMNDFQKKLSPMQGWIIGYLFMNQNKVIYQKSLEQEFGMPKSTLASILKQLDEKGLIVRESATHDSRLKCIKISEKGLEIQKEFISYINMVDEYMREGVSEEEIDTFLRIGLKFRMNLERHLAGKSQSIHYDNRKESDPC